MNLRLRHGDCVSVLREYPEGSIGAIVSDPPYGLEFMGKEWDKLGATTLEDPSTVGGFQDGAGGNPFSRSRVRYGSSAESMQAWHAGWLHACYRVLMPGGRILAFGGSRVYHRMAAAMEAAGFTDTHLEAWNYGSGFPKSLDVSKAIDKAAGAQREVVCTILDRWAGKGHVLKRAEQASRLTANITAPATDDARRWDGWGTALKPSWEPVVVGTRPA